MKLGVKYYLIYNPEHPEESLEFTSEEEAKREYLEMIEWTTVYLFEQMVHPMYTKKEKTP